MKLCNLLSSVSLACLALAVAEASARAQEQLPTIDVGKAKPQTAQARNAGAPTLGAGQSVAGAGAGSGSGALPGPAVSGPGYGGAGAGQDPYNPTYVLEDSGVGTKTDTPVMETPFNVQTVTQQVLKDQQVTDLAHALQNVSGVTTTNGPLANGSPYDNIVIRGFQANYIYRDGFRVDGGQGWGGQQFANVQSVEVLKGAAAVLYGLSEPGGIVNIVTKQPLDQPYYAVNQQVGSLGFYRTTIDATGPITSDKAWLYRINMSYENNGAPFGSFIQNTRSDNVFIAPVVKWNIDQDNWVKLEALYNHQNFTGYFASAPEINGSFVNIPRNLSYDESSPGGGDTIFAALTYQHNFDKDWSIKQMMAYNRLDSYATLRNGTGLDTTPPTAFSWPTPSFDRTLDFNEYSTETFSTNVDITGHVDTWGAQHTLLMGGDFYKTLNWNRYFGNGAWISPISILYPVHPGIPFLLPLGSSSELTTPQDTAGLYIQDQIKLPYDLFFMAGARYQYFRQNGGVSDYPSAAVNVSTAVGTPPEHANATQFMTPRFGLLWRPQPWVAGYISYAEGFSTNTGYVYPNTPVPPTGARDSEIGVKFEFLDGKLRANIGYYDLTRTNQTEPDLNPNHVCAGNYGAFPTCVVIVGESRTKGPEVDVQGTPLPGLNLILNYTNISSALTKTVATDTSNLLGQPFPGVPRNLANFTATYELQDGPLKGLKLGATYSYHGAQRVNDNTGLNLGWLTPSLAGYGTVDLLAEYPFNYGGWKYSAGVNIHNLLDRTYYTSEFLVGPLQGLADGSYGGGRAIGDNFSVMGHLRAEFPGSPPPPNRKPAPPMTWAHDWSGPYAGLQVGAAWGDNDGAFSYVTPDGLTSSPSLVTTARGVLAGAHLGYNQQLDHWVLGLEGSVDVTNLEKQEVLGIDNPNPALYYAAPGAGSAYCNTAFCGGSIGTHIWSNVQGSLRARVGYAWNRFLLYGTGGLALANFNLQSNIGGQDVSGNYYFAAANDRSLLQLGWTLGAGVEYAITPRWSARAEWRYTDFGHITEAPTNFSAIIDGPVYYQGIRHVTQDQMQVGFSYKFGGEEPELVPVVAPIVKGPAVAANLPSLKGGAAPSPEGARLPINWTGFYVGGQAGYAYGDNHGAYNLSTPDLFGSGALTHDAQGVIFGAHLGYNYQFFDHLLVGLEGSVDGTTLIERETIGLSDANGDQGVLSSFVQSDIQGAVRARAGLAVDRLLAFAAGGLAIGHFGTQSDLASANNALATYDGFATRGLQWTTRVGWTVGGGVEWAVNNNWSIRGEYRYSDFGNLADAPTVALPATLYGGGRHLDQNQVQFGFSYKFGDPVPLTPVSAKF